MTLRNWPTYECTPNLTAFLTGLTSFDLTAFFVAMLISVARD